MMTSQTSVQVITSRFYHSLIVLHLGFCLWLAVKFNPLSADTTPLFGPPPFIRSLITYYLFFTNVLLLPTFLTNIPGVLLLNTYPLPPVLEKRIEDIPFLCIRVVTRGHYPELVRSTVQRNIETCRSVGLKRFIFEVVTETPVITPIKGVSREIIVPESYTPKYKSLFKARALNYLLEPDIDRSTSDQWIVHLDEESLLTKDSVIGLSNFASGDHGDIGQGRITYANEEIVSWIASMADVLRVAMDFGTFRFSMKIIGAPVLAFKGAYFIVKQPVEKDIGFDFGPTGSITEDILFGWLAWSKGYRFNFVEGEVWEKSPFSCMDYIRQRSRWFSGYTHVLTDKRVPLRCKVCAMGMVLYWFLLSVNIMVMPFGLGSTEMPLLVYMTNVLFGGCHIFMFTFGTIKSFKTPKYSYSKKLFLMCMSVIVIPITMILDGVSSLHGMFTRNRVRFHIVEKGSKRDTN